jgi:hypothetical protein
MTNEDLETHEKFETALAKLQRSLSAGSRLTASVTDDRPTLKQFARGEVESIATKKNGIFAFTFSGLAGTHEFEWLYDRAEVTFEPDGFELTHGSSRFSISCGSGY